MEQSNLHDHSNMRDPKQDPCPQASMLVRPIDSPRDRLLAFEEPPAPLYRGDKCFGGLVILNIPDYLSNMLPMCGPCQSCPPTRNKELGECQCKRDRKRAMEEMATKGALFHEGGEFSEHSQKLRTASAARVHGRGIRR